MAFFTRAVLAVSLASAVPLVACSKTPAEPGESQFKPAQAPPADPGPATLQITDDVVGKGAPARDGDKVRVHYTGTLMNGKKFDSSRDKGVPFDFTLGNGEVIKGWDQGVVGMKVGGKRRLLIPQALGYGEAGSPPDIPSKAGLKFDIELLAINPKTPLPSQGGSGSDLPPDFDPSALGDPGDLPPDESDQNQNP